MTLNEVVTQINNWATAHKQINHFKQGNPWEFNTSGTTQFPAMLLEPQATTLAEKTATFSFTAWFMDLVDNAEGNEQEVLSDMHLVALDFVAQLTNTDYDWKFDRTGSPMEPFTEFLDGELSGWRIDVSLVVPFDYNKCQIPQLAINIPVSTRDNQVTITDSVNPNSPIIKVGGESYTCLPASISSSTCQQLNDDLTQAQRQLVQRVNLLKTGQTASTNTGDDGELEKGRLVDFLTLDCNNSFGDTNRFTDSAGGQDYDGSGNIADYMIDFANGLGWQFNTGFTMFGTDTYPDALTAAAAHDNGTFSNFRLPNWNELQSLVNCGAATSLLNYAPITNTSVLLVISNTNFPRDTSKVLFFSNTGGFGARRKTDLSSYIYVRNHF